MALLIINIVRLLLGRYVYRFRRGRCRRFLSILQFPLSRFGLHYFLLVLLRSTSAFHESALTFAFTDCFWLYSRLSVSFRPLAALHFLESLWFLSLISLLFVFLYRIFSLLSFLSLPWFSPPSFRLRVERFMLRVSRFARAYTALAPYFLLHCLCTGNRVSLMSLRQESSWVPLLVLLTVFRECFFSDIIIDWCAIKSGS